MASRKPSPISARLQKREKPGLRPVHPALIRPGDDPAMTSVSQRKDGLVQFIAFVATGSVAAIVNLASRYFLDFAMPFELAVVLAYLAGMVVAFLLFQRMIFGNPGTPLRRRVI